MKPARKRRLWWVLFIVFFASIAIGLTLYSLTQNINLFYSPSQIAQGEVPAKVRIRVGGMVVKGSVKRDPQSLAVRFQLTDYVAVMDVAYIGILPDLFREEQGIVAQGVMDEAGIFQATEVLAKHDEKYMPPEVADALKKAGKLPNPSQQELKK